MSLLQRALERAENPEAEPRADSEILKIPTPESLVKKKIAGTVLSQPSISAVSSPSPSVIPMMKTIQPPVEPLHDAPRLNAIRFYETQNQAVEEAIQETLKTSPEMTPEASEEETKGSRRNFLGLIFLLLILSFGAVRFILPSSNNKIEMEKPQASIAVSTGLPQTVVVQTQTPLTAKPVSQVKLLLTGITASGDTTLAVINNQVVGTGDKLREGAIVKSISGNRVVLDLNGKQIVLDF